MTIHPRYIGCDVSKHVVDFFDPHTNKSSRLSNTPCDIARYLSGLAVGDVFVVFEATGRYDRHLRAELVEAGIDHARVNPSRARHFAKACGLLAKTDKLDARMLSMLGEKLNPEPDCLPDEDRNRLYDLQKRYDELVQIKSDENRRKDEVDVEMAVLIDDHIAYLDRAIADIKKRMDTLVTDTKHLKDINRIIRSAPGIGPVTARVLLAQLRELGHRSPGRIASLAGVAPFNCDTGIMRGTRRIKGGRRRVRQAMYMATLAAIRSSNRFRAIYLRIKERAKSAKVAIIAAARKLLVVLNAMVRNNQTYVELTD